MEAPDKIYVSRNFSEDDSPHGLWYLNKSEHDVNFEYIRKDTILDKLKIRRDKCVYRSTYWDFWQAVINQINEV